MNDNTCICCGALIPEGRQVCKACEEGYIANNQEALRELFAPIFDAVKDLARRFGELIADDVQPKTIPPRSPVRCIGCRPVTKYRKPQIIRRTGCRHR